MLMTFVPIVAAAVAGGNVLWLPLGDSITWGCTGPTIEDCHGFQNGTVGGSGYRSVSAGSAARACEDERARELTSARARCIINQVPLAVALSEPPLRGCAALVLP